MNAHPVEPTPPEPPSRPLAIDLMPYYFRSDRSGKLLFFVLPGLTTCAGSPN